MVGLFPHLLRKVQVALSSVDAGVNTKGQRFINQQLVGVEIANHRLEGVLFVLAQFLKIRQILAQLHLIREPRVSHRLVVQAVRPVIAHRLELQAIAYA